MAPRFTEISVQDNISDADLMFFIESDSFQDINRYKHYWLVNYRDQGEEFFQTGKTAREALARSVSGLSGFRT